MNQGLAYEIAGVMPAALATGLFVDTCTFQTPDLVLSSRGFPSGDYVDVVGLVDLAAMVAPSSFGPAIQADETKAVSEVLALNYSHIMLGGYYPAAETVWRNGGRLVLNGAVFENQDIMGVESDSQKTQTRVAVRVGTI